MTLRMATKFTVLLCCSVAFAQNGSDLIDDFSDLTVTSEANADTVDNSFDIFSDASSVTNELDINVDTAAIQDFIYNVRLNSEGKISGRLQMKYSTGKTTPAEATIKFAQDGNVISSTETDDNGRFETAGLKEGRYMATVAVGENSAQVPVEVLAYDPNAATQLVIEGTLTPVPEGELIVTNGCDCGAQVVESAPIQVAAPMQEMVVSETFTPDAVGCGCEAAPVSSGFQQSCGSCGGGGGGGIGGGRRLGGLLGAAGLAAGVTALAIDDDAAVSPAN